MCDLFDPLASAQFVTTFSNASPAGVAFTGALRVPASSPRGDRDARLPVQLSAPSSVYGYLSCVRYLLLLVSTMRAPSAAARMYHANACCCSYLLYLCYLPYVCCLLLLVSTVYVPSASARIYHACDICCCSYLPYVCCLLQLVPNVYVLSAASRIYCIILSIQFMNYFEYSIHILYDN